MLRFSLRNLLASKVRLLLTLASVVVGVAFVSGTFVLSDTMVKAFDELYAGLTSGTDVVVRAESAYDADLTTTGGQVRPLDEKLVDTVRQVPGVDVAEGSVFGFALIIDPDGKPIQPGGAPTFGTSIAPDRRLSGAGDIREGRAPDGPGEVVIDAQTARKAGFEIGDDVEVVFQDGHRSFRLVGIVGFGDTDSILGATMTGFDLPTAQDVLSKPGLVDEIDVRAVDGVSAGDLRERIAAVLPADVESMTGEQVADDSTASVKDALGVFTTVLLVFAGISLLVGSFVIWNTFNVLVAQRRREVGLLRAVGGTRRQVVAGVLIEALVIGAVAGLIGMAAGVGLATGIRELLKVVGLEMPTTSPALEVRTIVVTLAVAIGVTCVAALLPAWSAARISPMEALRAAVPVSRSSGRLRHVLGWTVLTVGGAMLLVSSWAGNQRWWTLSATLTAFLGLVFVGPSLARGLAALFDHTRRTSWRMAARNISRSSRRAAATALALTIGLTVVTAVAVTASSLKESVATAVTSGNRADVILEPAGMGMGISSSVADLLRGRDDIGEVVEMREWGAQIGGDDQLVTGVDAAGLDRVIDLGIETGDLADLQPGAILVSTAEADQLDVEVGGTLLVTFPETGKQSYRVVGTFSKGSLINSSFVVTLPDFEANVTSRLDAAILVRAAAGVGPERTKDRVEAALTDYPNVTVNTPDEVTRKAQDAVDQLLGIVTALLVLAIVVAVLGVVNTLVLSVMERNRELGVLRAVGATRRQVGQILRRESILMALLGALTGAALGTAAGIALSRSLGDEGITTVVVPVTTVAAYVVAAVAVGVLAAIGPSRRAGKVNVLHALAED